jgi:hypothetical protein
MVKQERFDHEDRLSQNVLVVYFLLGFMSGVDGYDWKFRKFPRELFLGFFILVVG